VELILLLSVLGVLLKVLVVRLSSVYLLGTGVRIILQSEAEGLSVFIDLLREGARRNSTPFLEGTRVQNGDSGKNA